MNEPETKNNPQDNCEVRLSDQSTEAKTEPLHPSLRGAELASSGSPASSVATNGDFVQVSTYQILSSDGSEDFTNGSEDFVKVRESSSRTSSPLEDQKLPEKGEKSFPKPDVSCQSSSVPSKTESSTKSKLPLLVTSYGTRVYDDDRWSISFEQFLASVLTEPDLCVFFERKHDPSDAINRLRNRHGMERSLSVDAQVSTPLTPTHAPAKKA